MFVKYFMIIPSGFVTFLLDKLHSFSYNIVRVKKRTLLFTGVNAKGTQIWK